MIFCFCLPVIRPLLTATLPWPSPFQNLFLLFLLPKNAAKIGIKNREKCKQNIKDGRLCILHFTDSNLDVRWQNICNDFCRF